MGDSPLNQVWGLPPHVGRPLQSVVQLLHRGTDHCLRMYVVFMSSIPTTVGGRVQK